MARFLLVGGAGFIGSHLARLLVEHGEDVTVLDAGDDYGRTEPARRREILDWRHRELLCDVPVLHGDTRDLPRLREIAGAAEPTHIVHLANLPLSDLAAMDPAVAQANIVEGTVNVLHAAAGLPRPPALTYVSSSMVYGDFDREPMPEDAPRRPHCVYGCLKLAAERALATRAQDARVPLTVVRPSAVYGPGDINGRVLQRLVDAAAQGSPFVLHTTPEARLDFTSVHDVAAGLHAAALAGGPCGSVFNITAGKAHTLRAAIAAVRRHAPHLEVVDGPQSAVQRPRRGTLDIGRARRELGWTPRWT
ncbi:MAG: NAD(P)-dependent oxidoreductase, partial [Actinomycetota bacterium]|nr:NAD(P)-dependent oxidoreductase [Actinomycetota bacterium]